MGVGDEISKGMIGEKACFILCTFCTNVP